MDSLWSMIRKNPGNRYEAASHYIKHKYFYPWLDTKYGVIFEDWIERNRVATTSKEAPQGCTTCLAIRFIVLGMACALVMIALAFVSKFFLLILPLVAAKMFYDLKRGNRNVM